MKPATTKQQLSLSLFFAVASLLLVSCQREAHAAGSVGRGYGNLYVNYGYGQRGTTPRDIQWAIVFTEIPAEINSRRTEGVIWGKFEDGSQFESPIGGDAVFWIAPGAKVQKIETDSPSGFVKAIEETQDEAVDMTFDGPRALTEHLGKIHAEQAVGGNRR